MTLKVRVPNLSNFDKKMEERFKKTLRNVRRQVRVASNQVRNTAITSILNNPRAGGTVTRYNPTRTIQISKEGDPPASDTGFLASNIHVVLDADQLGASVESRAKYSNALEFGTRHMQARPFMQPALEQGKRNFKQKFRKAVKDGI